MKKLRFNKMPVHNYMDGKVTTVSYECDLVDTYNHTIYEKVFKVSGKAECDPRDYVDGQPDTKKGFMIADSRAKLAAYEAALEDIVGVPSYSTVYEECYNKLVQRYKEAIKDAEDTLKYLEKISYLRKQEAKHINKLIWNK